MFDLPNAKRIRRADLKRSASPSGTSASTSAASDAGDDPTSNAALLARLNESSLTAFDPSLAHNEPAPAPAESEGAKDDPEEFTFRLFSSASKPSDHRQPPTEPPRIRLESPGVKDAPPGILRSRPLSYYRARPLDSTARARFTAAVVEGEAIQARAQRRCPGLVCAWRVTNIPRSGSVTICDRGGGSERTLVLGNQLSKELIGTPLTTVPEAARKGRGRIGKKARAKQRILRRREAKRQEEAKAEQEQRRQREEHALEKKRALNRKKQHKKREKRALEKATTGEE